MSDFFKLALTLTIILCVMFLMYKFAMNSGALEALNSFFDWIEGNLNQLVE